MSARDGSRLDRRRVVARLLEDRGRLLVIAGLGAPAWDATAAGDHPLTLPLWGAMGGASMIGLGLALARPADRVLVITGDGEMLMGLGSLATVAVKAPRNLAIVVLDNERYGETGMQTTHTAHGVDLAGIARAAGFVRSETVTDEAALADLRDATRAAAGPLFFAVKVAPDDHPLVLPPKDGAWLKDRFRRALLGEEAAAV